MMAHASLKPIIQASVFALAVFFGPLLVAQQPKEEEQLAWNLAEIPAAWKMVENEAGSEEGLWQWYRCVVKIPNAWRGQELKLFCEAVDDARLFAEIEHILRVEAFAERTNALGCGASELTRLACTAYQGLSTQARGEAAREFLAPYFGACD